MKKNCTLFASFNTDPDESNVIKEVVSLIIVLVDIEEIEIVDLAISVLIDVASINIKLTGIISGQN
jgi:hypothetical protein